jgi:4-hydroxy-tetrahydrodipicolinate synthase
MKVSLGGVVPALLTPMDGQSAILIDVLARESALLTEAGVDALCLGGPLGELSGASAAEIEASCRAVRSNSTLPLVVNLYVDSTSEAIDLARGAESAGADVLLISQPHYLFQPGESGILRQFAEIRKAVNSPVLLSNSLPSAMISAATIQALVDRSLIEGLYQAADRHLLADVLRMKPRLPVFTGIEDLLYVGLVLGAKGIISSMAAIFPEALLALKSAIDREDHETARSIHARLLSVWRCLDHPSERFARAKHALSLLGRPMGSARSPYDRLPKESAGEVEQALETYTSGKSR